MASTDNPTLYDFAQAADASGVIGKVVHIAGDKNPLVKNATAHEANGYTSHTTIYGTDDVGGEWRSYNEGVAPTHGGFRKVVETMAQLTAYSEVDKELADLNNNTKQWRFLQDKKKIDGIGKQIAEAIIYGNQNTNPKMFNGIAIRYNDLHGENADNIIDAGGTSGNLTSIYLGTWASEYCHLIYPKGSKAGLQIEDLGQVTLSDAAGKQFQGYRTYYKWDIGLALMDWRYWVRIANIDVNALTKDAKAGADLITLMTQASERLPSNAGVQEFYMSRKLREFLRLQISNKTLQSTLSIDNIAGKRVLTFDGLPVQRVDRIMHNEARVV